MAKEKTEKHLSKVVEWFLGSSAGWVASQLSQIGVLLGFFGKSSFLAKSKTKNLHASLMPTQILSWILDILDCSVVLYFTAGPFARHSQ